MSPTNMLLLLVQEIEDGVGPIAFWFSNAGINCGSGLGDIVDGVLPLKSIFLLMSMPHATSFHGWNAARPAALCYGVSSGPAERRSQRHLHRYETRVSRFR